MEKYCVVRQPYGCFLKWWYPQIIHFNRVFLYKPSILGGFPPIFRKHPYSTYSHSLWPYPFLGILQPKKMAPKEEKNPSGLPHGGLFLMFMCSFLSSQGELLLQRWRTRLAGDEETPKQTGLPEKPYVGLVVGWTTNTVDGQNPAPPRMMIIPFFIGF